jgi:hypothetical protein
MKKIRLLNKSGITLVEITIATLVLTMVFLSIGTIYVSGVKEMMRIADEIKIQTEITYALDHIWANTVDAKDTSVGTSFYDPATPNVSTLVTKIINDDPSTSGQDETKYIRYNFNSGNKTIEFYPDWKSGNPGASQVIANYTTSLKFTRPLIRADNVTTIRNFIKIEITAVKGRMQRTFTTGVVLRQMEPGSPAPPV